MKERIKSTPYFAAYQLKDTEVSPTKTTVNNPNKQFSRVINRLRMLPATSYLKTTSINKINIPAVVQPADKHWFRNYE